MQRYDLDLLKERIAKLEERVSLLESVAIHNEDKSPPPLHPTVRMGTPNSVSGRG